MGRRLNCIPSAHLSPATRADPVRSGRAGSRSAPGLRGSGLDGGGIFAGLSDPFWAARYHSLAVDSEDLPERLRVVAWTREGLIMGLAVPGEATWGVQFHPESFLTPEGEKILASFLKGTPCREDSPVAHVR